MPSLAALTIYFFGLTALHHGVSNLVWPKQALAARKLPEAALPALNAFSITAIGIGIYYCLGAYQENRAFFALTLARFVSTAIFWAQGPAWQGIARFEGISAVVTGLALLYEGSG
ncbi:unnamed protein product [Clonostachys solani]|uniref:Uncharacterized protein n=1 Tax=Clonostachys solani TaxID=160281 RepID=A0A9N9ZLD1_9HYPO|nr:unnamed protein product [Clonostachys solani]